MKIESLNDDSRVAIMKNKNNLSYLKTEDNMKIENFARDILKMLPAGNGHLREKDTFQSQSQSARPPLNPAQSQSAQPRAPHPASAPYQPRQPTVS